MGAIPLPGWFDLFVIVVGPIAIAILDVYLLHKDVWAKQHKVKLIIISVILAIIWINFSYFFSSYNMLG